MYRGQIVTIPVGFDGLRTDDPPAIMSLGNLTRAINVTYQGGVVEKDFGSRRWNSTVLPDGVVEGFDWAPDPALQRLMALCRDGRVYRFTDQHTYAEVGATGGAPDELSISETSRMLACGAEETGNARKLFIMTGTSPVQVIEGDGTTRRDISMPAFDWAGSNHPIWGVIHRGILLVITRQGHTIYGSLPTNHEDFQTTPLLYPVAPGESERISEVFVFRGKVFCMKYPRGLYVLVDSDPSASNWYFAKVTDAYGAASARSGVGVFDDFTFGNEYGSITSLAATDAVGDVLSSDWFAQLRCQSFVTQNASIEGYGIRQAIYYKQRKIAMFTFRGKTSQANDLIAYLDFTKSQQPKVYWNAKDQANCLFTYRDTLRIERPFYGADDGYIYQMDQEDRWVGGRTDNQTAYSGEFWTPAADLGQSGNAALSDTLKNFEHLECIYIPTGRFKLFVQVFIDGRKSGPPLEFLLNGENELDVGRLSQIVCDPGHECSKILPLRGQGRKIELHCYNDELGENFKILKFRVYCQPAGQAEKGR